MIRERRFRVRDWHEIERRLAFHHPDVVLVIAQSLKAQQECDPRSVVAITVSDVVDRAITEIQEIPTDA